MGKLKNARQAREEILAQYFELEGYVGDTATTIYRGKAPPLDKESCFGSRDCLQVIKANDEVLDEVFQRYFRLTGSGIRDPAGNVYRTRMDAICSLDNDLYNQVTPARKKSGEVMPNGR